MPSLSVRVTDATLLCGEKPPLTVDCKPVGEAARLPKHRDLVVGRDLVDGVGVRIGEQQHAGVGHPLRSLGPPIPVVDQLDLTAANQRVFFFFFFVNTVGPSWMFCVLYAVWPPGRSVVAATGERAQLRAVLTHS